MEFSKKYETTVLEYTNRTPKSKIAYEESRKYIAGGETRSVSYYNPYPLTISKGKGSKMYDLDGNEYIDYIGNYTSLIHGHAHPKIVDAIKRAAELGTGVPAGIREQSILAKMICDRVESVKKVRFCNSGTEATMFAIRIARAHTGKDGIIKMLGGYHGTTDICEYSISPFVDHNNLDALSEPIPESAGIPKNAGKDVYVARFNDLTNVEKILKAHHKKIAAIITEPFLGAGGVIVGKTDFIQGLRSLANKYNVLLIFDEVQSFRLSPGGAQKKYGVKADITAFGKIIGGGLPVGAFGGDEEIMSIYDPKKPKHLSQSGTFNGNRATMAAGISALELLDEPCINYMDKLGERLENGIHDVIDNKKLPICLTRAGSLLNIHLVKDIPFDYVSSITRNEDALRLLHLEMLNRGIFCAPRGLFVISSVMDNEDIDKAIYALEESLNEVSSYII